MRSTVAHYSHYRTLNSCWFAADEGSLHFTTITRVLGTQSIAFSTKTNAINWELFDSKQNFNYLMKEFYSHEAEIDNDIQ